MSQASHVRTYDRAASVVFLKTNERFGGLSNMAPGFPLRVNGFRIRTSEALYQACRFPHLPDVQRRIIDEHSPMTAKMRSKPFRNASRPDWDAVRVKIMRWSLRVKLAHHWSIFGELLLDTGDKPIVEQSRKDDFWGAKVGDDDKLVGMNVLGRLLMELREEIKSGMRERSTVVLPLEIPDFLLFEQSIEAVGFDSNVVAARSKEEERGTDFRRMAAPVDIAQRSLFGPLGETVEPRAAGRQIAVQSQSGASQSQPVDGLRPYPEMKASGVEWLPALPAGWEIRRAKYSFKEADDRSEAGGEELLSVSHKTGVTPRSQKNITMFMAESYEGHKVCRPGDIVVNTMWAWMAAIGVSRHVGIVSPAYGIYRPRAANRFEPKFLDYLLRTEAYRAEYLRSSRGVTTSRLRLYPPDFLNIPFVQPPLDEQRLIVRFLDWHGAQTAKLIRAKKKIIALLNEQKQAIIHRAVTRGLDPNVRLKPSGIPWLGDVPQGWEVKRLKWAMRLQRGFDLPADKRIPGPHPVVSSGGIIDYHAEYKVEGPGVVMGRYGSTDAVFYIQDNFWPHNTSLFVTDFLGNERWWCFYVLRTISKQDHSNKAAVPGVDRKDLFDIIVTVPSPAEQVEIVKGIEDRSRELNRAITSVSLEIGYIQEFRTRLIADVVTGKLDVRAAAASLPESTEPEPIDELTQVDDLDGPLDQAENEEVAA